MSLRTLVQKNRTKQQNNLLSEPVHKSDSPEVRAPDRSDADGADGADGADVADVARHPQDELPDTSDKNYFMKLGTDSV